MEHLVDGTDLWMYFLSRYTDAEASMKIQQMAQRNLDQKELYYKLIEDVMRLPIDYIEGILTPYYNPEINNNKNFIELVELLFEEGLYNYRRSSFHEHLLLEFKYPRL